MVLAILFALYAFAMIFVLLSWRRTALAVFFFAFAFALSFGVFFHFATSQLGLSL
ncbi:MAG: hypothetical protein GY798_06995 [Hyphomicrobiales bacterium]|nr:hypothetical protein [Hyphomicrobiales bacterium]